MHLEHPVSKKQSTHMNDSLSSKVSQLLSPCNNTKVGGTIFFSFILKAW